MESRDVSIREAYSSLFRVAASMAHACEHKEPESLDEALASWRKWCDDHCVRRVDLNIASQADIHKLAQPMPEIDGKFIGQPRD